MRVHGDIFSSPNVVDGITQGETVSPAKIHREKIENHLDFFGSRRFR